MKRFLRILFLLALSASAETVTNFSLRNITVAGTSLSEHYLAPAAYLRLDETNDLSVMADVIGGQSLTNVPSGGPLGDGFVLSWGGQITNSYKLKTSQGDDFSADPAASSYDFGTNDFAIRLWISYDHDGFENSSVILRSIGATNSWTVIANNDGFGTNWYSLTATWGGSDSTLQSTNVFSNINFHRVVFWHRQGGELGIKFDNHPSETLSFTNLMGPTGAALECLATGTGNTLLFDEIAVWKGYVPSPAELLDDWNSGAGRTYPFQ